jgi:hypothetical protein
VRRSSRRLCPTTTPRTAAPPRQMGCKCRKEKQSDQTVRPKTLLTKGYKKGAAKPERTFLEKKSTCVSQRLGDGKMTMQGPKNKGQCSSVGTAQPKEKLLPTYTQRKRFFHANSDSACLSGLLTYIVRPCTPSPLTSGCQFAPSAPSPLATELIHAAAALPVQFMSAAAAAARSTCPKCPVPDTFCAATAAASRSTCPGYSAPSTHYVIAPVAAFAPPQAIAAAASPCPRLRPPPGTCAAATAALLPLSSLLRSSRECYHRRRRPWFVPRVPRPRYALRRHRRRCSRSCINLTTKQTPATATSRTDRYVHPSLELSAELSLPPRETSCYFSLIRPHPRRELRLINIVILTYSSYVSI